MFSLALLLTLLPTFLAPIVAAVPAPAPVPDPEVALNITVVEGPISEDPAATFHSEGSGLEKRALVKRASGCYWDGPYLPQSSMFSAAGQACASIGSRTIPYNSYYGVWLTGYSATGGGTGAVYIGFTNNRAPVGMYVDYNFCKGQSDDIIISCRGNNPDTSGGYINHAAGDQFLDTYWP